MAGMKKWFRRLRTLLWTALSMVILLAAVNDDSIADSEELIRLALKSMVSG